MILNHCKKWFLFSCLFIKVSVGERLNFNLGWSPYLFYLKNSVKCKTIWNLYTKCKRSKWDKIVDTLISNGYLGKFGESTVFYWRWDSLLQLLFMDLHRKCLFSAASRGKCNGHFSEGGKSAQNLNFASPNVPVANSGCSLLSWEVITSVYIH